MASSEQVRARTYTCPGNKQSGNPTSTDFYFRINNFTVIAVTGAKGRAVRRLGE
jgi:hypothetical protein